MEVNTMNEILIDYWVYATINIYWLHNIFYACYLFRIFWIHNWLSATLILVLIIYEGSINSQTLMLLQRIIHTTPEIQIMHQQEQLSLYQIQQNIRIALSQNMGQEMISQLVLEYQKTQEQHQLNIQQAIQNKLTMILWQSTNQYQNQQKSLTTHNEDESKQQEEHIENKIFKYNRSSYHLGISYYIYNYKKNEATRAYNNSQQPLQHHMHAHQQAQQQVQQQPLQKAPLQGKTIQNRLYPFIFRNNSLFRQTASTNAAESVSDAAEHAGAIHADAERAEHDAGSVFSANAHAKPDEYAQPHVQPTQHAAEPNADEHDAAAATARV